MTGGMLAAVAWVWIGSGVAAAVYVDVRARPESRWWKAAIVGAAFVSWPVFIAALITSLLMKRVSE